MLFYISVVSTASAWPACVTPELPRQKRLKCINRDSNKNSEPVMYIFTGPGHSWRRVTPQFIYTILYALNYITKENKHGIVFGVNGSE